MMLFFFSQQYSRICPQRVLNPFHYLVYCFKHTIRWYFCSCCAAFPIITKKRELSLGRILCCTVPSPSISTDSAFRQHTMQRWTPGSRYFCYSPKSFMVLTASVVHLSLSLGPIYMVSPLCRTQLDDLWGLLKYKWFYDSNISPPFHFKILILEEPVLSHQVPSSLALTALRTTVLELSTAKGVSTVRIAIEGGWLALLSRQGQFLSPLDLG